MYLLNSGIGNYVVSNGRRYSYFAGNNYLGLANHPRVTEASVQAIRKYGVNFSASRQTTGTADLHLELEKQLSQFKGKQDAVVYASGYLGNLILFETFADRYSAVFADEMSHPSIIKNIPREVSGVFLYDHLDTGNLEKLLSRNKAFRPLIVTDGIFALSGEIAPLDQIHYLAKKHNGLLIVDDAHSTGILGKSGKGTPEYFGLEEQENLYQTETMSKALGSYGGFIAGTTEDIGYIRTRSSAYQASTSLAPPVAAAAIASLGVINKNPGLHIRLLSKSLALRQSISNLGYQTTEDNTPIIPLIFPSQGLAMELSQFLEDNGIIAPFIRYPVRKEIFIVRITVSVSHTDEQTGELLTQLKKWKMKHGKN
jgi:7-keto-8-aminopelargonate synthetase-like enzyme